MFDQMYIFVYPAWQTRQANKMKAWTFAELTLASYKTLALVGSGSKHSTRSPWSNWYLIPREFICSWRRAEGESGSINGTPTHGLTPSCLTTVPPWRVLFRPKHTRRHSRLCRSPTFGWNVRILKRLAHDSVQPSAEVFELFLLESGHLS